MDKYRRLVVFLLSLTLALTTFSLSEGIGFANETNQGDGTAAEQTVQQGDSDTNSTSESTTPGDGQNPEIQNDGQLDDSDSESNIDSSDPKDADSDVTEDAEVGDHRPLLVIKIPESEKNKLSALRVDQPIKMHIFASNPTDSKQEMRVFVWKYNKDFYDKDKRAKASEADEVVTLKGLDNQNRIKVRPEGEDKDITVELERKSESKFIKFEVPANSEYEFDVELIPEDPEKISEDVKVILEPAVEDDNEELTEEEFRDSLLSICWTPVAAIEKEALKIRAAEADDTIIRSDPGRVKLVQEAMQGGDGNDKRRTTISIPRKQPDEDTIFQYLTGQSALYSISVSNEDNTAVEDVIRVYFDYSGIDYSMGDFPPRDTAYTIHNTSGTDYSMLVKQCVDANGNPLPGKYYYELTGIKPGETLNFRNSVMYNTPDSAGGTLKIWTVSMSEEEAAAKDGAFVEPYSWLELNWTTDPVTYTIAKENSNAINGNSITTHFEGDGSGDDTVYLKKLAYRIAESNGNGSSKNEGQDLVRSVDYTDTLKLPDSAFWREGLLDAIENGDYRVVAQNTDRVFGSGTYWGYTIYVTVDGQEYVLAGVVDSAYYSSSTTSNSSYTKGIKNLTPSVVTLEDGTKTVALNWHCDNPTKTNTAAVNEYPVKVFSVVYGDEVIAGSLDALNLTLDEGVKPRLNNTIKESREYSWSPRQEAENSINKDITLGANMETAKYWDNHNYDYSSIYGGANSPFTLLIKNTGIETLKSWGYTETSGTVRPMATDTLPEHMYITPENLEKLFASKETVGNKQYNVGDWIDLEISPATLCTVNAGNEISQGQELFAEDNANGKDKYRNGNPASDETALTTSAVLKLKNVDGKLTLTVSNSGNANKDGVYIIGNGGSYGSLEEAFNKIGFEVTGNALYRLKWQPKASDNFVLKNGQRILLHVPASMKTTFMRLSQDQESYLSGSSYFRNSASFYATYGGTDHAATRYSRYRAWSTEAYVYKYGYINGSTTVVSGTNIQVNDGSLMDYRLEAYKYNQTIQNRYDYDTNTNIGISPNQFQETVYEKMPMTDLVTGPQVVLVPKADNPDLTAPNGSALETYTDSNGIVYWMLNQVGTYTNLKFGTTTRINSASATARYYEAESITVTRETDKSLSTVIKWKPFENWGGRPRNADGSVSSTNKSDTTFVYYKTLVSARASGMIEEGDTAGHKYSLNNKCWLGDHQRHRLYDFMGEYFHVYNFSKHIADGPEEDPGSKLIKENRIRKGQTVTYRMRIQNISSADVTLKGSNIYDALPQTRGAFEWSRDNVTNLRYVTEDGSVHILDGQGNVTDTWNGGLDGSWEGDGDSHWSIKTTGRQNSSVTEGQYYINWDDDFAVKMKTKGVLYIYVDLTWPSDGTTWDSFVGKNNGAKVTNTFYLGEQGSWRSDNARHLPLADAKAVIRKGVYDTGWTTKGGSTSTYTRSYRSRGSRSTYANSVVGPNSYSNSNLHNSTVTYYTEVYNGSNERLYLEPLQDKLPKGFTYDSLTNTTSSSTSFSNDSSTGNSYIGSHAGYTTGSIKSEGGGNKYATVNNSADPTDNHSVSYVNFTINGSTTMRDGYQYLTFTINGNTTNYDSNVGKYFLDPGQAVRFGYNVRVGAYGSTEDEATNTVTMPYCNQYNADFTMDDYNKLKPSTANSLEPNDGECEQMTAEEVKENYGFNTSNYVDDTRYNTEDKGNWLVSSVTVEREKVVPGMQKSVAGYNQKVVTENETTIQGSEGGSTNEYGGKNTLYGTKYAGGLTSSQVVNWRLRLFSEGNTLTDYTVVDTVDAPYQFTGKVFFNTYYATGTGSRETSSSQYLFTLGTRTEDDTKVRISSGSSISGSHYINIGSAENDSDDSWFDFGTAPNQGKVKIEKLADGREQMTIQMIGTGLSIPEHRWMDLCVHTQFCKDMVIISEPRYNDVIVKPTQDYNAKSVAQGRPLTHSETIDGQRVTVNDGVQSGASVMIVQGYMTSSVKHITEIGNPRNTANSEGSPNYIALSEKSKKFKYDLNITGPKAIMSKVVLIDALPEVGDHSAFVATDLRNSDYMVSLWAENPDFHVYIDRGGAGEAELSADKYTIEISEKHDFSVNDWNGKSSSDWINLANATEAQLKSARSFRVIIDDPNAWQSIDESLYMMPDDSNIHVSFNASITDPSVKPGQTAWNSFGYYYTVPQTFDGPERIGDTLMAQPLNVGVTYPAAPVLTKKLVDEEGEAYKAKENLTFGFVIYKGDTISSLNNAQNMTEEEIAAALGNRDYIFVPLTVKAGDSEAEIAFYNENFNLAAYDEEEGWIDKTVDGHTQLFQWTGDEQFQVVELPFAGGQFSLKAIGNSSKDEVNNNYTFIQDLQEIIEFTATNEYAPEMCQVTGSKKWSDDDNRDRVRPSEIKVGLYANNKKVDEVTVTEEDDWAFSFTNLTKYDENGNEIEYTLKEDKISDYTPTIEYEKKDETAEEVYTINGEITNSHTPKKTYVEVDKKWIDGGAHDNLRPEKIVVNLLADGEKTGDTIELSEENSWHGMFTDLNVNKDGVPIQYTVEEEPIEGYKTECTGNMDEGFLLTNTREGVTTIDCSKDWDDQNNKDGSRPGSIVIKLMADGVEVDSATANANSQWQCSFSDLPRFNDDGTKIKYSIMEVPVDGYSVSYKIDGSIENGNESYSCRITNFHEPIASDGTRTGDDFRMLTWCLLLLLSGVAMIGIPALTRRRKQTG